MMNATFEITEDTFSEWANRILNNMDSTRQMLMEEMEEDFLADTAEFVPSFTESLEKSVYNHVEVINGLESINLFLTWTGVDDIQGREWEFAGFQNYDYEDYALSNYLGEYYRKQSYPQKNNRWVDKGAVAFQQNSMESLLTKVLEKVVKTG